VTQVKHGKNMRTIMAANHMPLNAIRSAMINITMHSATARKQILNELKYFGIGNPKIPESSTCGKSLRPRWEATQAADPILSMVVGMIKVSASN
jgi:hypothetical protein